MDKQKQINEIADIIFEALNNKGRIANGEGVDIISEALYNAGYRKIPENAVVLTREEFEWTTCCFGKFEEIMNDIKEQAREETAEKFALKLADYFVEHCGGRLSIILNLKEWYKMIDEIAKEITEGEKEISNETV